jgi:hypothetical protein
VQEKERFELDRLRHVFHKENEGLNDDDVGDADEGCLKGGLVLEVFFLSGWCG